MPKNLYRLAGALKIAVALALLLSTQAEAQVRSLTLGISVRCPYGLTG